MNIAFIAKFSSWSYDEQNYASALERLGHNVYRVDDRYSLKDLMGMFEGPLAVEPDLVIWFKFNVPGGRELREFFKKKNIPTVCWVFDLYWDYGREGRLLTSEAFKADYVFTTDGGHDKEFKQIGINHQCVRQGIDKNGCHLLPFQAKDDVIFVGSENYLNKNRTLQLGFIMNTYKDKFRWYGKFNTNEVRNEALNDLFAKTKIVIGDSVYSPYYWSNRVVETLGRGGFLIHQEVEGLKEEYPDLVTYPRGDYTELKRLIDYYMTHEDERRAIIVKNHEHVKKHYLMEHKCQELLNKLAL